MSINYEKLIDTWKGIGVIIAVIAGGTGIAISDIEFGEDNTKLMMLISKNTEAIESLTLRLDKMSNEQGLERWNKLNAKRRDRGLPIEEYQEFCRLGSRLFVGFSCPPNKYINGQLMFKP